MNRILWATAPIRAIGEPRPRARVIGSHASVYVPAAAKAYRRSLAAMLAGGRTGSVERPDAAVVWIRLDFARPKSHRLKRGGLASGAPVHHVSKPDTDNAAKSILDTLTDMGVLWDDACVTSLRVLKRWADRDAVHVGVWRVPPE